VNISPAQPPRTQRILPAAPIITTTAAMLVQSLSICKNQQEKEQEEHELVEHPVVSSSYYYTTPTDSHDQNHDSKKTNFIVVTDAAQDYGYKYEFCHSQPPSTSSLQDGNCWQAPSEQNDSSFDDDDDHSEPFLDHYYQSNSADLPFGSSMQINANKQQQISSSLVSPAASDPCVYLLGSAYHPALDYERQRNHELSLYWFTYRSDFPEIAPYHITCDAGWGCMLRSAQMLLAQALRVHFKSRNYSSHHLSLAQKRREPFLRSLLIWMADLTLKDSVYSLHNMVATGMAKYEILPGEWYGPGSACHVLRDLVHAHEAKQLALWTKKQQHRQEQEGGGGGGGRAKDESTKTTTYSPNKPVRVFRVHVASQGTVYYDAVRELMTQESRSEFEQQQQQQQQQSSISATKQQQEDMPEHPLATAAEDLQKEVQYQQALERLEWDTGLLLLIPLRLGLQTGITEEYAKSLAYIFSLPQSVGVLGGRPRGARWYEIKKRWSCCSCYVRMCVSFFRMLCFSSTLVLVIVVVVLCIGFMEPGRMEAKFWDWIRIPCKQHPDDERRASMARKRTWSTYPKNT